MENIKTLLQAVVLAVFATVVVSTLSAVSQKHGLTSSGNNVSSQMGDQAATMKEGRSFSTSQP